MVTNFFTFSAFIIVAKSAANFDWAVTKTDLESKRELWLNTDITSYHSCKMLFDKNCFQTALFFI